MTVIDEDKEGGWVIFYSSVHRNNINVLRSWDDDTDEKIIVIISYHTAIETLGLFIVAFVLGV